jgi:cation diffusion facilitator CzcD-associated flavoprotein CzcO
MWSSLLLPLIALPSLVLSLPTADAHHPKNPVCIIGAGPAGLAAAGRLQDKGISAVVFDRQDKVGGKCQSWYDDQ